MSAPGRIASIRERLLNKARHSGEVFDYVIARYAIERFLYRLSVSDFSSQYVLKGALLFYVWHERMHRPTRDVDFLGFGPADAGAVAQAFQSIANMQVPDDGLTFFADSVSAESIREEALYGGIRVKLLCKLGNIRIPLHVDVGFGDAITPEPALCTFPALLPDYPPVCIRSYPIYTVVAEKLEAMVSLGDRNTRMKDFFDLRFIVQSEVLDPVILSQAIKRTFERRKTALPQGVPHCLTQEYARVKEQDWNAFLRRNGLEAREGFAEVLAAIQAHLPYRWGAAE